METPVAQEVIDEAKLDAWQSYCHPDLVDEGEREYAYSAPFVTEGLEVVLVGNETLSEVGIEFTPLTDLDVDLSDYPDSFENRIYRLDGGDALEVPSSKDEQTLAELVAPNEDTAAVSFSTECADRFPSVHHLAVGSPLLDQLVEMLLTYTREGSRLTLTSEFRASESPAPVICGWGRDGDLATLTAGGEVQEDRPIDLLTTWCDTFLRNRDETSPLS